MRRSMPLLIILGILLVLVFMGCGQYNNLVQQDENVKKYGTMFNLNTSAVLTSSLIWLEPCREKLLLREERSMT
jgi:hypothetical protein